MQVEIRNTNDRGRGVFATDLILEGQEIFDWTGGPTYEAEEASDLPRETRDHAIQFAEHKWIDTDGFGRYSNHSCEPNSGIKGLFKLVALRDIKPGEEILWDYDTTENSDWVMEECKCGSIDCRKVIKGYRFLPLKVKEKVYGYISDWIKSQSQNKPFQQ